MSSTKVQVNYPKIRTQNGDTTIFGIGTGGCQSAVELTCTLSQRFFYVTFSSDCSTTQKYSRSPILTNIGASFTIQSIRVGITPLRHRYSEVLMDVRSPAIFTVATMTCFLNLTVGESSMTHLYIRLKVPFFRG